MKEYRIVGKYGMWGEILDTFEDAETDRAYAEEAHGHIFRIEERDVSDWRKV